MTQKIDGNLPAGSALRTSSVGSRVSQAGEDRSNPVSATAPTDSVSLTGEATGLQNLQRQLSSASAVDDSRVESVRSALQSGSYQINPDVIANRMVSMDQQLAG